MSACTHKASPEWLPNRRSRSVYVRRRDREIALLDRLYSSHDRPRFRVVATKTDAGLSLVTTFNDLASQWRRATRHLSLVAKIAMHPAYQRIIGMGDAAVPLILQDLARTRGPWLWALQFITGKNPAETATDYDAAVDAWLRWGRERGHI